MMKLNIKRKLQLIVTATTFAVLVVACSVFSLYQINELRRISEHSLLFQAEILANSVSYSLALDVPEDAEGILRDLLAETSVTHAGVYDAEELLFSNYIREGGDVPPDTRLTSEIGFIEGHLIVTEPIYLEGENIGTLLLRSDLDQVYYLMNRNIAVAAIIILLSSLLAFFIANKLQAYISNPINDLAATAQYVSEHKDYSIRATQTSHDEIGTLVLGINEMLQTIEENNNAITESEELYRLLAENVQDIICTVDPKLVFTYLSPSIELLSGYTPEELLGKSSKILYAKGEFKKSIGYLDQAFSSLTIQDRHDSRRQFEAQLTRKDGTVWEAEVNVSLLFDQQGEVTAYLGVIRDITDRKVAQNQLLQSQKMESIGQLAGGVAHDFNNLLLVISGYIEIAQHHPDTPSEIVEYLDEVAKASDRAAALTRQLLAFSRQQVIETVPTHLNELIEGIQKMVQRLIPEDISFQFSPCLEEETINADRGQLEQVLMNLCVNARDAMPDGGSLVISTSLVNFDAESVLLYPWAHEGDFMCLSVSDSGTGIPDSIRDQVFDPFFTTKPKGKGTGLGLSMVLGIIEQHGGFVHIYSEQNIGTDIKLYFPLIEAEPVSSVKDSTKSEDHTESGTILIVEDDEQVRNIATLILENSGYSVMTANDGKLGVEKYKEFHKEIDLVLMDVVMPNMNGRVAMDEIRKINNKCPILFASGYASGGIHTNFLLDEEFDLIIKPYTSKALCARVKSVLERKT